jgi:hypothetical protein
VQPIDRQLLDLNLHYGQWLRPGAGINRDRMRVFAAVKTKPLPIIGWPCRPRLCSPVCNSISSHPRCPMLSHSESAPFAQFPLPAALCASPATTPDLGTACPTASSNARPLFAGGGMHPESETEEIRAVSRGEELMKRRRYVSAELKRAASGDVKDEVCDYGTAGLRGR